MSDRENRGISKLNAGAPRVALCLSLLLAAAAGGAEQPAPPPPAPNPHIFFRTFNTVSGQPWKLARDSESVSKSLSAPAGEAWDLRGFHALTVNAGRDKAGPSVVRLRWAVKSRVGGFYVSAAPVVVPVASTAPVTVALESDAAELVPAGHQRPWDALAAAEVVSIELRAECTFSSIVKDAGIGVTLIHAVLEKSRPAKSASVMLLDASLSPPPPFHRARVQLSFRLEPPPSEPYASSGEGDVRVVLPGGREILAFFDQNYIAVNDGQASRDLATGLPYWRAFLPDIPARGAIEIVSGERRWTLQAEALQTGAAAMLQGEAQPDPVALETPEAGATERWKVPLEVPPPDTQESCKGLPPASELIAGAWQFPAAAPRAEALWRPVPFWNAAWGDFGGEARPNIILARKMDALLAQAAAAGKSQPLVVLDGDMFDRAGTFNWSSHPLKGQIAGPGDLYRSPRGSEFCRRWMRYCIARWSLSKAVSAFWLTPVLNAPGATEFHAGAAPRLAAWARDLKLPVVALHPFAQSPRDGRAVTSFEGRERSTWRVERRAGGAYGNLLAQDGSDGPGCFEVRATDPKSREISSVENFGLHPVQWKKTAPDDFFAVDSLLFDVWVPPDSPPDLRVGVHVRDRDGFWHEALLYGMPEPGDWRTYTLDVSARNLHGLKPAGHTQAWNDYSRQRLTEFGVHIYSTHPNWTGGGRDAVPLRARFDHVRAARLGKKDTAPVALSLLNPESARTRELAVGEVWQCDLGVSKAFANPFDAAECDLAAIVTTPSGKQVRVPAFFNQNCRRREATPGGDEIVEPAGSEFFTVRYRAIESGPHRVAFELREGGKYSVTAQNWMSDSRFSPDGVAQEPLGRGNWGRTFYANEGNGRRKVETIGFTPGNVTAMLRLDEPAFVVKAAAFAKRPFRGFVRVADDKRHFQFDDGSFFYPIGPCLRSPSDSRIPYLNAKWNPQDIDRWSKRGTYQYDEYFEAFEKAGINWARVWMCSWWGSLEWRRDWPGYHGVGRYNLLNAWRIDHLLEVAEQKGIFVDLCLTNHGQFSLVVDAEWHNNPYNAKLGGPLITASEFFTRADAKIAHQNKLRYILARYGHSPAVMAWSLFSEIEWTEEYETSVHHWGQQEPDAAAPNIESWHTEMAAYLKALDPNKHLVATHYSHPVRGDGTLNLPAIDVATSNAYSAFDEYRNAGHPNDAPYALAAFWAGIPNTLMKGFAHFKKPSLVEEQGRHWGGGRHNRKDELEADMHCGLWGSLVQPLAGATGYWWWLHLHYDNRYSEYQALARFVEGEDFRPSKGESDLEPMVGLIEPASRDLVGRAMKSDRRMYLWVYHTGLPFGGREVEVNDGKLSVRTLRPGTYVIEFWNTRTGARIDSIEATLAIDKGQPAPMVIPLPAFKGDIALKIKPKI